MCARVTCLQGETEKETNRRQRDRDRKRVETPADPRGWPCIYLCACIERVIHTRIHTRACARLYRHRGSDSRDNTQLAGSSHAQPLRFVIMQMRFITIDETQRHARHARILPRSQPTRSSTFRQLQPRCSNNYRSIERKDKNYASRGRWPGDQGRSISRTYVCVCVCVSLTHENYRRKYEKRSFVNFLIFKLR